MRKLALLWDELPDVEDTLKGPSIPVEIGDYGFLTVVSVTEHLTLPCVEKLPLGLW